MTNITRRNAFKLLTTATGAAMLAACSNPTSTEAPAPEQAASTQATSATFVSQMNDGQRHLWFKTSAIDKDSSPELWVLENKTISVYNHLIKNDVPDDDEYRIHFKDIQGLSDDEIIALYEKVVDAGFKWVYGEAARRNQYGNAYRILPVCRPDDSYPYFVYSSIVYSSIEEMVADISDGVPNNNNEGYEFGHFWGDNAEDVTGPMGIFHITGGWPLAEEQSIDSVVLVTDSTGNTVRYERIIAPNSFASIGWKKYCWPWDGFFFEVTKDRVSGVYLDASAEPGSYQLLDPYEFFEFSGHEVVLKDYEKLAELYTSSNNKNENDFELYWTFPASPIYDDYYAGYALDEKGNKLLVQRVQDPNFMFALDGFDTPGVEID